MAICIVSNELYGRLILILQPAIHGLIVMRSCICDAITLVRHGQIFVGKICIRLAPRKLDYLHIGESGIGYKLSYRICNESEILSDNACIPALQDRI